MQACNKRAHIDDKLVVRGALLPLGRRADQGTGTLSAGTHAQPADCSGTRPTTCTASAASACPDGWCWWFPAHDAASCSACVTPPVQAHVLTHAAHAVTMCQALCPRLCRRSQLLRPSTALYKLLLPSTMLLPLLPVEAWWKRDSVP